MKTIEKPTIQHDHPIQDVLKNRWSPRAFDEKPVEKEELMSLLEAARWAASSFNEQPWRFIYAHKGSPDYDKILSSINEFNQTWAQKAPVLLVGLAKKTFSANGKPNKHSWYDLGAAIAQLTMEATTRDLYLHQMAGFYSEKIQSGFELNEDIEPVVAIALGYLGDAETLPSNLASKEEQPQQRKTLEELIINK